MDREDKKYIESGELGCSIENVEESFKQLKNYDELYYTNSAKELLDYLDNNGYTRFVYFKPEDLYITSDNYIHDDMGKIGRKELGCTSTEYCFIYSSGHGMADNDLECDSGLIYVYPNFEIFDRDNGFKKTSLYRYLGEPMRIDEFDDISESLTEKIVKKGSKWQVQSEKGKNLGTYTTKKEAEDRLKQVHYFKHMNEFLETDKFEDGQIGCIKENGSLIILDDEEIHGDLLKDILDKHYPEFNTVKQEDICVRIFNEPTKEQYRRLEEVIDCCLTWGYCKLEIFDNNKTKLYKIYSLYENACEDSSCEEVVGNWTGYDLVKIIKSYYNSFKHINEETFNKSKRQTPIYLYRGTSDRSFSKNNKPYAGLFFGVARKNVTGWGNVKKYFLKKDAKIYEDESSDAFCSQFYNKVYPELKKCFGMYFDDINIDKLNDFTTLSQDERDKIENKVEELAGKQFCWYDVWTWCIQLVARIELEKQGYDGARWEFEDAGNHIQYQIWNLDVIKSYDGKIESLQEELQETDNEGNILSKEQIEFFKNSKIRDNQGRLIVCYHGTDKKFDTFTKGDIGFHFGTLNQAKNRVSKIKDYNMYSCYLNIKNPVGMTDLGRNHPLQILYWWYASTFEGFSLGLDVEMTKEDLDEINELLLRTIGRTFGTNKDTDIKWDFQLNKYMTHGDTYTSEEAKLLRDILKRKGYDGIYYRNTHEDGEGVWGDYSYIAFDSNQIKSITNKNPTNSNNINESLDEFDSIVKTELDVLNRWLDKYGFEVKLITDKETLDDIDWSSQYGDDAVGMLLGEIQDNASVFPVALNKKVISELCKEDSYDEYSYRNELMYGIRGTLWHEAGHGIYRYLEDFYEMPEDEEDCVEEFARYREVSELFDILQDYMKQYESLKEEVDDRNIYYRGYDSRYGVFDSDNEYGQLYTWVTDAPEYALEYAENNEYGKVAKVRITCNDAEIGGVLDLPEDVDYYDPGDEEFQECILDQGLKGYGFEAGDYDDFCLCISKDCVEVIDPDVKVEVEDESLNESKQDIEKFRQWAGDELANRFFAVKDRLDGQQKDIYFWMKKERDNLESMLNTEYWKDKPEKAKEFAHRSAIESLESVIEKLEDTPTRKQLDKQAKEGAEKIYEDDRWLVVKINTYGASVKYGKNTQWCITGTNSQTDGGVYDWKYHHEAGGCDFYFYIDKKNNHKYALEYYDNYNWALYTEDDYVDVGMGWPFNSAMDALGEPWSPYEHTSYPAFPKVNGLPDLQQAYKDAIADISEDSLDADDFKVESLNENLNVLDALDKEFGQEEVYMWSTYILPNGHFLNPDNAQDYWDEIEENPGYEHYDFEDWAYAKGYNLSDIYDNCVKMNVTYPYLGMPDKARPTQEQLNAIRKIIENKDSFEQEEPLSGWYDAFGEDKINAMGNNLLAIFTPKGDEVFDLDVSDADDIIRAINQAYIRGGFFNESLNESKADWEKFRQWCDNDELYNRFMKLRPRLANIRFTDGSKGDDIYFWMKNNTPKDLEDTLQDLEVTPTKKEREKRAQEGAKLLYNQNGWKVYKIETQEASQKYGKGSMWCISGEGGYDLGDGYWEGHEDCTYFFIHGNEKYALIWHKGDSVWDIWNEEDEIIPYIPNAPKVDGLPDVSKLPDFITRNVAKLYNISVEDIKDIKSVSNDPELMELFLDYDSKQNFQIELKDGTIKYCYVEEFSDFIDVTKEIEELMDEYFN